MEYASIGPIAVHLPANVEDNRHLKAEFPSWNMELVYEKTGIRQRHIASPSQCASDLGVAAAARPFAEHQLAGATCLVLGTDDSRTIVQQAGGEVIPITDDAAADVVIVCDEDGFPFLHGSNATLTLLFRVIDGGRCPTLILPNPDLIYPRATDRYGVASGAIALMLEAALAERYGPDAPTFVPLGKPHSRIFTEAKRRASTREMIMIGDQLATDIAGANNFGIDSALIGTGLATAVTNVEPTYLLPSLAL